jgi:hypothetical protein
MFFLHVFAGLIGFYLFSLTYVMRESTEGQWVNRIEEFWVHMDDRSKTAGEATSTMFKELASRVAQIFNRIVGTRLLSIRLVGISSSLSFASFVFILGLFLEVLAYLVIANTALLKRTSHSADTIIHAIPLFIIFGLIFLLCATAFLCLALLPIFLKSSFWEWVSCGPALLLFLATGRLVYLHLSYAKQVGFIAALAASVASDVVLLIIVRTSLSWLVARSTIRRMVGLIAVHLIVLMTLFAAPLLMPISWRPAMAKTSLGVTFFSLAMFNIPTAIASMAFLVCVMVVLLHRVLWPLMSRMTYILTRNEVLEKRKTVRTIGLALMLYGLAGFSHGAWLRKVLDTVFK